MKDCFTLDLGEKDIDDMFVLPKQASVTLKSADI